MKKLFILYSFSKVSNVDDRDKPDFFWAKHKKQLELYIKKNFRTDIFDFRIHECRDISDWKSDEWNLEERKLKLKKLKRKIRK